MRACVRNYILTVFLGELPSGELVAVKEIRITSGGTNVQERLDENCNKGMAEDEGAAMACFSIPK